MDPYRCLMREVPTEHSRIASGDPVRSASRASRISGRNQPCWLAVPKLWVVAGGKRFKAQRRFAFGGAAGPAPRLMRGIRASGCRTAAEKGRAALRQPFLLSSTLECTDGPAVAEDAANGCRRVPVINKNRMSRGFTRRRQMAAPPGFRQIL